jgi:glycosyltransferase involved in cell wall biosynthesis
MNVKVGTLMAVYRGDSPQALRIALDSVLQQRLADDVESRLYVAIDGPVPADIEAVIDARRDSIHRLVRLPSNRGLAAALNTLIATLEDEQFLFRMDADDRSEFHRYQAQLNYMLCHPDVDILGTDIVEVDQTTGRTRRVSYARDHDHAIRELCRRVPVAHPTVCFRRRVLDRTRGYPTSGTNEDIALWFRCTKEGFRFANLHEPLLQFTIGPGFWRRRSMKKAFSELRCYTAGIWSTEGVTWKYIFPVFRFMLRLAPSSLSRWAYASSLRQSR